MGGAPVLSTGTIDGTNIVTAAYRGAIASEEMDEFRSVAGRVVERNGRIRLLLEYEPVGDGEITPEGYVEDLSMAGILDDVERMVVLTDAPWIRGNVELFTAVISGPARAFDPANRDEALRWLRA